MLYALINVIIVLLVAGVIWWAINALLPLMPLPDPIPQVIRVLLIVILCIVVIYALLGLIPGGRGYLAW